MSRNYMSIYDEMRKGDYMWSNNKEYKAIFQEDGNFVIYGWRQMWSSETPGMSNAYRLCMQDDCNFVMYTRDNKALWRTNSPRTDGFKMCRMWLRNDGNLVIEKDGEEVWNSASSKGQK